MSNPELPNAPIPGTLAALAASTGSTSAAVLHKGRLYHRRQPGVAQHARYLLPLLVEVCKEAGVEQRVLGAIAFARGPGPFTADRIVVATAQGLGMALERPLIPVSSLAALAWASGRPRVVAAIDAGQGQIYWGLFRRYAGGIEPVGAEAVAEPAAVDLSSLNGCTDDNGEAVWWGCGHGWRTHGDTLAHRLGSRLAGIDPDVDIEAGAVAALGGAGWKKAGYTVSPREARPTYLRSSYAEQARSYKEGED